MDMSVRIRTYLKIVREAGLQWVVHQDGILGDARFGGGPRRSIGTAVGDEVEPRDRHVEFGGDIAGGPRSPWPP